MTAMWHCWASTLFVGNHLACIFLHWINSHQVFSSDRWSFVDFVGSVACESWRTNESTHQKTLERSATTCASHSSTPVCLQFIFNWSVAPTNGPLAGSSGPTVSVFSFVHLSAHICSASYISNTLSWSIVHVLAPRDWHHDTNERQNCSCGGRGIRPAALILRSMFYVLACSSGLH